MKRTNRYEIPAEFTDYLRNMIEDVPGCKFTEVEIFEDREFKLQNDEVKETRHVIFEIHYTGWSPTLSKIKIHRGYIADRSLIPGGIDFNHVANRYRTWLEKDLEDQGKRAILGVELGLLQPIETTGKDLSEIEHILVDRTTFSVALAHYGSMEKTLQKMCEFHHIAHIKSDEYEGYSQYDTDITEDDGYEINQRFYLDNDQCYMDHHLEIGRGLTRDEIKDPSESGCKDDEPIHLIMETIRLHQRELPETIVAVLPGKRVKDLVCFNHPVDNRIIKKFYQSEDTMRIYIEPDHILIADLMKQNSIA